MNPGLSVLENRPFVVVIDDDPFHTRLCELALSDMYRVTSFTTPSEDARQCAADAAAVLLDLNMAPLDGLSFLLDKSQTAQVSRSRPHLIICSAMPSEILRTARELAISRGFTDVSVLSKPVGKRELLNALEKSKPKHDQNDACEPAFVSAKRESVPLDSSVINSALNEKEITPAWQPQFDSATRTLTGFEVLARWQVDERAISPLDFIHAIEDSPPLAVRFALYMLDLALQSLKRWESTHRFTGYVSVNIPAGALDHPSLARRVIHLLQIHHFSSDRLVLEITETMDVAERLVMQTNIARLRMYGIQLSIDDFGMGYSNIYRLGTGLFNEIKIDAQFVRKMLISDHVHNVVAGIIAGARKSDMRIVAEGVETIELADAMTDLGCTHLQGALFAMPMEEAHLLPWMRRVGAPKPQQSGSGRSPAQFTESIPPVQ